MVMRLFLQFKARLDLIALRKTIQSLQSWNTISIVLNFYIFLIPFTVVMQKIQWKQDSILPGDSRSVALENIVCIGCRSCTTHSRDVYYFEISHISVSPSCNAPIVKQWNQFSRYCRTHKSGLRLYYSFGTHRTNIQISPGSDPSALTHIWFDSQIINCQDKSLDFPHGF